MSGGKSTYPESFNRNRLGSIWGVIQTTVVILLKEAYSWRCK